MGDLVKGGGDIFGGIHLKVATSYRVSEGFHLPVNNPVGLGVIRRIQSNGAPLEPLLDHLSRSFESNDDQPHIELIHYMVEPLTMMLFKIRGVEHHIHPTLKKSAQQLVNRFEQAGTLVPAVARAPEQQLAEAIALEYEQWYFLSQFAAEVRFAGTRQPGDQYEDWPGDWLRQFSQAAAKLVYVFRQLGHHQSQL
jgi:hypothetical protein